MFHIIRAHARAVYQNTGFCKNFYYATMLLLLYLRISVFLEMNELVRVHSDVRYFFSTFYMVMIKKKHVNKFFLLICEYK